ncbi:MAG: hypothetical protein A2514_07830 [Gammaproteobacteria bacterium RIFOXYD12_FULL_61_37]|nr:MAG: hypothetical protein A2514_07830 [Gammaproteobacteria bacterium RIFOXYD12_FULL_61_37]
MMTSPRKPKGGLRFRVDEKSPIDGRQEKQFDPFLPKEMAAILPAVLSDLKHRSDPEQRLPNNANIRHFGPAITGGGVDMDRGIRHGC